MSNDERSWPIWVGIAVSVILHGQLAIGMYVVSSQRRDLDAQRTLELTNRKLPEPEPPPLLKPVELPPAPAVTKPTPVEPRSPKAAPAEPEPPPEPSALAPEDEPPPPGEPTRPPTFGLDFEGTTQAAPGTGVPVPRGESLRQNPKAPRPTEQLKGTPGPARKGFKQTYAPGERAPVAVATTMPKITKQVVPEYPERMRDLGIEGRVKLELTINEQGRVISVKVLEELHPELAKVAIQAARQLIFEPARVGKTPVTLTIPYTFTFVLD